MIRGSKRYKQSIKKILNPQQKMSEINTSVKIIISVIDNNLENKFRIDM